jgi:hypothetical protein
LGNLVRVLPSHRSFVMRKNWEVQLIQSSFLEKDNSSNLNINKNNHENRGIDFILNGGKRKQTQPFHIIFEKMVCFLKREVNVYFEFSLSVRKRH